MLWPFHVRGHPNANPQLPAGSGVARSSAHQRCDACRRMYGVPPPVERHAVRLLHPRGHARVHGRVSDAWQRKSLLANLQSTAASDSRKVIQGKSAVISKLMVDSKSVCCPRLLYGEN